MTGGYESLEKVLKTIEAEKDLNLNNIIEKIKTELEERDQGLYKNWEEGKFDVNYVFSLFFCECTLLTIAAENGYTNIVNVLLGSVNKIFLREKSREEVGEKRKKR
ncbi:hypothetical protein [Wolbachia endosymbiont of Kerria lacca]|uniref:hypothetical protein n=1 Tax=Wolbachia endosymbiont of Kerria lacca TaxID=427705 RepID=UPI003F675F8C